MSDKKKKGLADAGEGEFILNESGTSISTDRVEEAAEKDNISEDTHPQAGSGTVDDD